MTTLRQRYGRKTDRQTDRRAKNARCLDPRIVLLHAWRG